MAIINFNAATVEPQKPLETVPAGWYTVMMVSSDMKPTAKKDGHFLETEYEIMFPVEHKGRKLFDRFNLDNTNPTAVEIAYKALSAVCHAVNVIQVQDSQQLHGKPLQAKVKLVPAGPGADGKHYDAKNEISGYKAADGTTGMLSAPQAPAWATQPSNPANPAAGVTPPWAAQQSAPAQAPAPAAAPTPPWAAQPQQQPVQQAPVQTGAPTPPWAAAPQAAQAPTPPWAGGQVAAPMANGAPTPPWAQQR